MDMRSKVPERGRDERDEGAAEVVVAGINYILIKIIPGVFALIHRESIFLRVQDYRRRVLGSRRWRGRISGLRRRVRMGVGENVAVAVKILKILKWSIFGILSILSVFGENVGCRDWGRRSYGKGEGFYALRVYAGLIGWFGGKSVTKFHHCGRVLSLFRRRRF